MASFFDADFAADLPADTDDAMALDDVHGPPASSSQSTPLFLPDELSDDEPWHPPSRKSEPLFLPDIDDQHEDDDDEVIEVPSPVKLRAKAARRSESAPRDLVEPARKKPRVEAKPALAPSQPAPKRIYLGEMYTEHAYSLVSGRGEMTNGDKIVVARDVPAPALNKKQAQTKLNFGQKKAKATPKVLNKIVSFNNARGFELGRIGDAVSTWVAPLLDQRVRSQLDTKFAFLNLILSLQVIYIEGSVVDCPDVLRIGSDIILRLKIYLRPAAYKRLETPSSRPSNGIMNDALELPEERDMRMRKTGGL